MARTSDPPWQLHRETVVARPLDEVFAFFAKPKNIDVLTPPWMSFDLQAEPPPMACGTEIEARIRVRGLSMRWTSLVTVWEPPHRFVDEQTRGPYRRLSTNIASRRFRAARGSSTTSTTRCRADASLGRLVHRLVVGPDLAAVFDYRQRRLREIFGAPSANDPAPGAETAA